MNLDELVLKSLGKRPLIREKIKERRRKEVYSSIENIENLILNRDKLATKIMRSKLSNIDCSDDLKEFEKLQNSIDELLLKNGFSKNYLSNYFVCEKCKDTGYFNGTVCSCIMHDLVEDRVLESGFSNKKREQSFDNFDFSLFVTLVISGVIFFLIYFFILFLLKEKFFSDVIKKFKFTT